MSGAHKGWAWFERDGGQARARADGGGGGEDLPDPDRALRLAYARCFGSADGEKVLDHLRAITLERTLGPSASADMLRHIEGQRQLVSYIAALARRGRDGV
ncbi:hypothetical protein [Magnetovibrio sp.]|uniref:Bbp19 family protein n=1 Tax=Magnetovibrio sp. TaxID=2024836 RepID=UPI002F92DD82